MNEPKRIFRSCEHSIDRGHSARVPLQVEPEVLGVRDGGGDCQEELRRKGKRCLNPTDPLLLSRTTGAAAIKHGVEDVMDKGDQDSDGQADNHHGWCPPVYRRLGVEVR